MSQFNWKELDIRVSDINDNEYLLHVKYLPSEFDNLLSKI